MGTQSGDALEPRASWFLQENFHIDHIVKNCFGPRRVLCSFSEKRKGEGNLVVVE